MNSPMKNLIKVLAVVVTTGGLIAGCSSSSDYNFEASEAAQVATATAPIGAYDPANGILPLPNDLLFTGQQDGTLNIPGVDDTDFSNPRAALNALDGWSTIEPIVADFSQTFAGSFGLVGQDEPAELLDAASIAIQDSVRVFEVSRTQEGLVTGVDAELDATQAFATSIPADPTVSPNGSQLAIFPVQPLNESTTYMVLVTNGVKNESGTPLARGLTFNAVASTNPIDPASNPAGAGLQAAVRSMLEAGNDAGVSENSVVLAWTFTTQNTTGVLQTLKEAAITSPIGMVNTQLTTAVLPGSPGIANIFAGAMSVPYYLEPPSAEDPTAPLKTFMMNADDTFLTPLDSTPVVKSTVTIPVLMTVPNNIEVPATGWPVAIFQHGITRARTDALAIADALASAGYATIAIDIPMHGISPDDEALAGFRSAGISERHFDVDYVNNDSGAPGPDGSVDSSGTHYINLSNLLNTRANNRQAIADLFTLSASIGSIQGIPVNAAEKIFIGHSLGAIIGTSFLGFDDTINRASLGMGGGGIPRFLASSPAFAPLITAGLASAGIDLNSADGNAFINAAQTVVDSIDPINHARAAGQNTIVHMMQINGDSVVLNNVPGFPLVGTEPLARIMGLAQVSETTQGSGFVKFSTGYHSSILNPADANTEDDIDAATSLAVFQELQSQVAQFAEAGTIVIGNPDVIEAVEETAAE